MAFNVLVRGWTPDASSACFSRTGATESCCSGALALQASTDVNRYERPNRCHGSVDGKAAVISPSRASRRQVDRELAIFDRPQEHVSV